VSGVLVLGERPVLAELPHTQMQRAGGSLAIGNGRLALQTGITGNPYMSFL
jgi:hypothetical protein